MFSQAVIERIGNYVYFLRDPRNKKVFYVGKGIGNRVFMHVNDSLEESFESDKLSLIREIRNNGLEVEHHILRHNISNEVSIEIESALIDFLGLNELKNKVKGHNSFERGLKSINEIIEIYDSEETEISEPSLLITVNKYFNRDLEPEELYKITRYCWKVSARREKARYIFSVFKGLIREVYVATEWKPIVGETSNPKDKGRWYFNGHIAEENIRKKYIGKSVLKYVGARNPIKYVNC